MDERSAATPLWDDVGDWSFLSNYARKATAYAPGIDDALTELHEKYGEENVRVEQRAFMRDGKPYPSAVAVWVRREKAVA